MQAYKDRYIRAWVLFSAPLAGAPKALRATISGDDCGFGILCEGEFWNGQPYACQNWYQPISAQTSGLLVNVADGVAFEGLDVVTLEAPGFSFDNFGTEKGVHGVPRWRWRAENFTFGTSPQRGSTRGMHEIYARARMLSGSFFPGDSLVDSYNALTKHWWSRIFPPAAIASESEAEVAKAMDVSAPEVAGTREQHVDSDFHAAEDEFDLTGGSRLYEAPGIHAHAINGHNPADMNPVSKGNSEGFGVELAYLYK